MLLSLVSLFAFSIVLVVAPVARVVWPSHELIFVLRVLVDHVEQVQDEN